MKKNILLITILSVILFAIISATSKNTHQISLENCEWNGIKLHGKVQFVKSFPDIKIQFVESFPDIKVKFVESFPNKCGKWQIVKSFPDIKIQVVESFPDLKVKTVESFPGIN